MAGLIQTLDSKNLGRLDLFIGPLFAQQLISQLSQRDLSLRRVFFIDGGLNALSTLQEGGAIWIGDQDSLSDPTLLSKLSPQNIHRLSPRKNETDTEAAIRLASSDILPDSNAFFLGVTTGRRDHDLANHLLWFDLQVKGVWGKLFVLDEQYFYVFFRGSLEGFNLPKAPCALFSNPLIQKPHELEMTGFEYNLCGESLNSMGHGVSNKITSDSIRIKTSSDALHLLLIQYSS